jgi:hypothetical protein
MSITSFSQRVFYQDILKGGVTGAGFSAGITVGFGAFGQIIASIDPSSTIKKAYLLCNRYGNADPVIIGFNGNNYLFDLSSQIGQNYITYQQGSNVEISAVHAIDVTNEIAPTQNIYDINIPAQPYVCKFQGVNMEHFIWWLYMKMLPCPKQQFQ